MLTSSPQLPAILKAQNTLQIRHGVQGGDCTGGIALAEEGGPSLRQKQELEQNARHGNKSLDEATHRRIPLHPCYSQGSDIVDLGAWLRRIYEEVPRTVSEGGACIYCEGVDLSWPMFSCASTCLLPASIQHGGFSRERYGKHRSTRIGKSPLNSVKDASEAQEPYLQTLLRKTLAAFSAHSLLLGLYSPKLAIM